MSLFSSSIRSSIFPVDIGSSAEVGSSISKTDGLAARARAMQSRCCCPPLIPRALFLSLSLTSSHIPARTSEHSTISSISDFFFTPKVLGANAMFSYMLIGNGLGFWKTMPTFLRRSVTSQFFAKISFPPTVKLPVMRQPGTRSFIRLNIFRNVDLPQPDGPMRAVISFAGISMLISFSARKSPYQRLQSFTDISALFMINDLPFFRLPCRRRLRTGLLSVRTQAVRRRLPPPRSDSRSLRNSICQARDLCRVRVCFAAFC